MQTTVIQAIPTSYRGYRFRSRLEARWAVFFDAIGIEYQYELQGYNLSDGLWYLPDFWLPQVHAFAEVKPAQPNRREMEKIVRLVEGTTFPCVILQGPPDFNSYPCVWPDAPHATWDDVAGHDVVLGTRHLHEQRFYACTGYGADHAMWHTAEAAARRGDATFFDDLYLAAVERARGARFA